MMGWAAAREAATELSAEVRARPLHLMAAAVVVGLVAGPRAPIVLLLAAPVLVALAGRAPAALLCLMALLGGAVLADARLGALDRTALTPRLGHATTAHVTLVEPARTRPFGGRSAIAELGGERVLLEADEHIRWPGARVGDVLLATGGLEALLPRDAWLRPRNVHARLELHRLRPTGRSRGGLAGAIDDVRSRAEAVLGRGVAEPQAALLRGIVLGQDEGLGEGMREEFRTAGLSHLVAASGQNVMLLAALVFGVATVLGVGLHARLAAALLLIALYVPLAGAGASIQRAGVMGAAGLTAALVGRPAARWYALLLAAAITLGLNPRAVEEPGWQMSFVAVAAIILLCGRLAEAARRRGIPPGIAEALAMTVAASIGTAPLIALHFGRTSLVSVPANLLAAPVVAPIMWLGMLAGVVGQVSTAAAAPFTALASPLLGYLTWVGEVAAGLPSAEVVVAPALVAAVCLALVVPILSRRARRPAGVAVLVATFGAIALVHTPGAPAKPPDGLRITFLDVGQGDATLIQHRDAAVLIDAGPPEGDVVGRLRRAGVAKLDVLVVTHAQADHDGGAADVLRAMPVGLVLDGRDGVREPFGARMAVEAARRAVPRAPPEPGQVLHAGGIELKVLWPEPAVAGVPLEGDPNDRAIVAVARSGRFRVLLTADAESEVLNRLDIGTVDVLKVAHHGSADEGLAALLERTRPRVAAIGVGAANTFGHPTATTLATLRAAGVAVYRTDRDGSIRMDEVDGTLAVRRHA